jgi:hypothetical protein
MTVFFVLSEMNVLMIRSVKNPITSSLLSLVHLLCLLVYLLHLVVV